MNSLQKEIKDFFSHLSFGTTIKIIGIVGLIVFFNSFFNPFVWDDNEYILNAPEIHTLNPLVLFGNNIFNNANQYRPLAVTYFAIAYSLFGTNQFFYHIIQFSMHLVTTVLVYVLFTFFLSTPISLFLSLIFLVHPMQIESASYIASSGGNLLMIFGLTALILSMKEMKGRFITLLQYVLLLAAMLIKETGVLFVFVFLLFNFLWKKPGLGKKILYSIASVVIYLVLRFAVGNVSLSNRLMIPIAQVSLPQRLLNMPKIFWYYIQTYIFPRTLVVNQQWVIRQFTLQNVLLPLFLDALFFIANVSLGVYLWKKHKKAILPYIFFAVWFLIGMGLHSQIVPLDETVADKWFYFDMIGLLGMIGIVVQQVRLFHKPTFKSIAPFIGITVVLLLGIRTIVRQTEWQSPVTLFSQAITVDDNYMNEEQLAYAYIYSGQFPNALQLAKNAAMMFPSDTTFYNLGYVYENLGNRNTATQYYIQALQAKNFLPWKYKHYLEGYIRPARMLIYQGKYTEAENVILNGLKDYPNYAQLLFLQAVCEYKLGNYENAVKLAKKTLDILPNNPDYQNFYQRLINKQPIEFK